MKQMLATVGFVLWILISDNLSLYSTADILPSCRPEDFHYEYTECDSEGGRWRVSVPKPGICTGGSPNAPVRGKGCDFTCKAGEYLDIENDQECHPCPAGHYSLGGGVRFEDFGGDIPKGFHTELEGFTDLAPQLFQPYFGVVETANCSGKGWYAKDDLMYVDVKDCTAVLSYTANLVQPGSVSFVYQNEDEDLFFSFEVQNSQCQSSKDSEDGGFLRNTKMGKPLRKTFELKTGINILYWRAFKPTMTLTSRKFGPKTRTVAKSKLIIYSIDITGVAYTSSCTQCKAGTYSEPGSAFCKECPENTYGSKGASQCFNCDLITEYSEPGSDKCTEKLACTERDYYEYYTPCDSFNTTQKQYKWIEPQTCRPDLYESVQLPPAGEIEPCPPCNPGMELVNGSCRFCRANHYSTGSGPCISCPGSTAPQTGLVYKWWNSLQDEYNITAKCLSNSGRGCASEQGWIPAGDHINSGHGHRDDVYLMLNLKVGGFKGREEQIEGKPTTLAKISFMFELNCDQDCELTFMQRNARDGIALIKTWSGYMKKTVFQYEITKKTPTVFTWAFQKLREPGDSPVKQSSSIARIYTINVTNTLEGGAQECRPCPKGASQHGCIPCPEGQYVVLNTSKCAQCPEGRVAHGLNPWGVESCVECGRGLTPSWTRSHCVTSCTYSRPSVGTYDYTQLAKLQMLNGSKLFTASGNKYYNQFRLSICGGNGIYPLASCSSNISREHLLYSEEEQMLEINSPICRVTALLTTNRDDPSSTMYTQHISLGDLLLAVTHEENVYNISQHKQEAGFMSPESGDSKHDVHFVYASDSISAMCPHGLKTIITLRCDMKAAAGSTPTLPSQCVTGTCDGCTYMLLWRSRYACPRCESSNFTEFTDICVNGKQKVLKIWPKDCYYDDQSTHEVVREQECSMIWQDRWPLWLKAVVISIPVILVSGCLLLLIVCYCWLKNRKLKYKYMKLVESSSGRDGENELPQVDSCGLDEGEEDEQFDVIELRSKGKNSVFTKFGRPSIGRRKDRVGGLNMEPFDERTRLRGDER